MTLALPHMQAVYLALRATLVDGVLSHRQPVPAAVQQPLPRFGSHVEVSRLVDELLRPHPCWRLVQVRCASEVVLEHRPPYIDKTAELVGSRCIVLKVERWRFRMHVSGKFLVPGR